MNEEKLRIFLIKDFENNIHSQDGIYYSHEDCRDIEPIFEIKDGIYKKLPEFGPSYYYFSLPTKKNSFDIKPSEKGFYYTIRYNNESGWHAYFDGNNWFSPLGDVRGDKGWLYPRADMSDENMAQEILSNMDNEFLAHILEME